MTAPSLLMESKRTLSCSMIEPKEIGPRVSLQGMRVWNFSRVCGRMLIRERQACPEGGCKASVGEKLLTVMHRF